MSLLVVLAAVSACSYRLDTDRIEADIKTEVESQGRRVSLASVTCPSTVSKQAEAYFRCVGELESGEMFTVNVTQQDDEGTVVWDIPSSKTLINLVSLEAKIQSELAAVVGQRVTVSCDGAYRVNARGDAFECNVVGTVTAGSDQIDAVLVQVNADGDLQWREVRTPTGAPQPVAAPAQPLTDGAIAAGAPTEFDDDD